MQLTLTSGLPTPNDIHKPAHGGGSQSLNPVAGFILDIHFRDDEIWKPIKDWETLYEISNYGRVKSLRKEWIAVAGGDTKYNHIRKPRIRRQGVDCRSYLQLLLCDKVGGRKITRRIHVLVWDHFGDSQRNGRELPIDHKDNNKWNNHISNLQVLPNRDNKIKSGLVIRGGMTGAFKHKGAKNWYSHIYINNKKIYLGSFRTQEDASNAYFEAKKKYKV